MAFSIDGLVSGLDTASIIEGLVSLQSQQVDRLTAKKTEIQVQQQAFQGIEGRLLTLRTRMGQLNRSSGSAFSAHSVSSSDESIVTATAGSKAAEGSFNLRVISRAAAQQIASTGFDSSSQSITSGTISFQVGDRPVSEVTIDSTNNTVSGLVQAINTQSDDVSAALIHDQATDTDRILLTSKHTGQANEITITNNLGVASGEIARPDFSGTPVQEAANATIQLGSGAGAITAQYQSNSIDGLIEGVTLNLKSVDVDQDVQIVVSRDHEKSTTAINDFVEEYNSLMTYINEQTKYDSETQAASPLLGNRNVANLKNELSSIMTEVVPGLGSGLNRFSQIGITITGTGELAVNQTTLSSALNGEIEGLDPTKIPRLFGMTGASKSSGIEFLLGGNKTVATNTPYEIDITQAAEQSSIIGTNSLASSIVIDETNNEFQLSIDGQASEILTLTAGTYTQSQLIEHVESVINASPELGKHEVSVLLEGGKLKMTSAAYGSSSSISNFSGSALAALGLSGTESGIGVDVAGSFIVDGITETATGNGRILIGDADNENTADLQIRVLLAPSQVSAGVDSELTVTRGVTSRLDQFLDRYLDSTTGSLETIHEGFDLRIESIESSIEKVNQISSAKTDYLIQQFAALETVLSQLQTTSSFVSSQLAGISQ